MIHWWKLLLLLAAVLPGASYAGGATAYGMPAVQVRPQQPGSLLQARADLVDSIKDSARSEKIARVNEFFNGNILYVSDQQLYRQVDYWAAPRETLERAAGDCEDIAIAKRETLILTGIPAEQLILMHVMVAGKKLPHMVLLWRSNDQTLVLDSLSDAILSLSSRTDLTQVYSFTEHNLWAGATLVKGNASTLLKWREMVGRSI